MKYCVENFDLIRHVASNSRLREFNDFWAPDYKKKEPFTVGTFEPERLREMQKHILWAPFFCPGPSDLANPPYFRVLVEITGRVIHSFKREYIDKDDERRISKELGEHVTASINSAKQTSLC